MNKVLMPDDVDSSSSEESDEDGDEVPSEIDGSDPEGGG